MFDKILIANRGEIACRVIRTCKRLGIKTVAVYSEADADALHVREADEKVLIGPPPSAQSYLLIDKIIEACKQTGAQAVHPGYGFLSEKEAFQTALAKAGITFIGPDAHAIYAMGDKIESKKLAQKAGVSTVPGHLAAIPNADEAVKIAQKIGYPVMIKASAGGGGKGMRIAYNDAEAHEGFGSATNEAKASFADDRVFVEKYVEEPRHIEIQLIADGHGNCIYLWERECSIQRRHQKVIEEAPSPFLDAKTRKAMGEQAVALAKAVKYKSAGTVEFIVDKNRNFYFLEMNTRLQVEHPVTELITGLDLVELMIRVAAGEKLPFQQKDVKLNGWAVEARLYAEDPFRNFLPSTGRLVKYREPEPGPDVRVDTGVYEGGEISMFYDPMIAKLCTYGKTRNDAIDRMRRALDEFYVRGVSHNVPFLAALMAHPRFVAGKLTTNFIAEEFKGGFTAAHLPPRDPAMLAGVAAVVDRIQSHRAGSVEDGRVVMLNREPVAVRITGQGTAFSVEAGDRTIAIEADWVPGDPLLHATVDGRHIVVQVDAVGSGWRLVHEGGQAEVLVLTPRQAELYALMPVKAAPDTSKFLLSPMPGLLASVAVAEGQDVKAGEALAVVEAMKMENVLRAVRDGTVKTLHAKAGDSLRVDQKIIEFA
ncbi:MAG: acetyl/propionyl/methylcrotonyl-CoA carboxylase subunit alpha [Reyranella sp.]|uniref:acetyl-CoA carboxylase biotin carboxylase subunit n=1 Tax=Reyranella sp. TaxID=1929291 RepID=UPI00095DACC9|nr:acetyl/propionyl/methylcrotonyl-CoA carboxylase subunit alpha [Reyranella sp.]MBN9537054.1 acetyl/propionyl/methylcrotonyl-CoA carboxylase subunit alpha [Alphaproteobacteria bacterium]MBR2814713.1 acetyl/propionyl/methylcrotonyl-CoA carboxylase subunit alpha [Reyranella sp.]OJU32218.1 MAG: acetyl/propionyl-CoA carboxylase subuit alpha [Alphaproteobacteria bacterium 65-37]